MSAKARTCVGKYTGGKLDHISAPVDRVLSLTTVAYPSGTYVIVMSKRRARAPDAFPEEAVLTFRRSILDGTDLDGYSADVATPPRASRLSARFVADALRAVARDDDGIWKVVTVRRVR